MLRYNGALDGGYKDGFRLKPEVRALKTLDWDMRMIQTYLVPVMNAEPELDDKLDEPEQYEDEEDAATETDSTKNLDEATDNEEATI
jgi:hypothetical protein